MEESSDQLSTLTAKMNYANVLSKLQNFEEAERIYLEVIEKKEELLG